MLNSIFQKRARRREYLPLTKEQVETNRSPDKKWSVVKSLLMLLIMSQSQAYAHHEGNGADAAFEEQLAAAGARSIVSCYAVMSQEVYYPHEGGKQLCDGNQGSQSVASRDNRNNMNAWYVLEKPANVGHLLRFWQRTSPDGKRRELAIANRGSDDGGDWVRDGQSQLPAVSPKNNAISNMASNGQIPNINRGKFEPGFHSRVMNIAPYIDDYLKRLEDWQSRDSERRIGVKVVGHSLGAAISSQVGTYVANRYWTRSDRDVEIIAYSSPKAMTKKMAAAVRNAASTCNFNVHIFNNSKDVVTKLPVGAHQIYGDTHIDSNPPEHCIYQGGYTTSVGAQGGYYKKTTGIGSWVSERVKGGSGLTFILNRHGLAQWTLGDPDEHLTKTANATAAGWFPHHELGADNPSTIARRLGSTEGTFIASLESAHGKYVKAKKKGGRNVMADTSRRRTNARFRFVPDTHDCVRHGTAVTLSTIDSTRHFLRANNGNVDARLLGTIDADDSMSFTVINHTSRSGCIKENDQISLQAYDGRHVVAEPDGRLLANRDNIGAWEKFHVRSVYNSTHMEDYNLDLGGGGEGRVVTVEAQHPVHNNGVFYNLSHGEGVPVFGSNNSYKHYSLMNGWALYYYEGNNYTGQHYCYDSTSGTVPSSIRYRINSARVYVGACYD
ncbi:MAG: hypothetical protein ACI9SP_003757 [Arenicella sp.]|jgi:hypothetical protein